MIEIVWTYDVKEEARGLFELAYGPGGAWSDLFSRYPGFRGTTLLRDIRDPRRYLTVDVWDSIEQRERMLADSREEYGRLDAQFEAWTESEAEVGIYRLLSEATVRPRGGGRRRGGAGPRRRRGGVSPGPGSKA